MSSNWPGKWDEPATDKDRRAITRLCMAAGIQQPLEEGPMTKRQARSLRYYLLQELIRVNIIRSKNKVHSYKKCN